MTETIDIDRMERLERELARLTADADRQADEKRRQEAMYDELRVRKPTGKAATALARQDWRRELRRRALAGLQAEHEQVLARAEPALVKLRERLAATESRRGDEIARHRAAMVKLSEDVTAASEKLAAAQPGPLDPPGWYRNDDLLTREIADRYGMPGIPN